MSETFYLLAGLLVAIVLILLAVLYTRKNFSHKLKFLGTLWQMETSDSQQVSKEEKSNTESHVDFGTHNKVYGEVGDIAGRDIVSNTKKSDGDTETKGSSSVNFGSENMIDGNVGDVAGRDIVSSTKKSDGDTETKGSSSVNFGSENIIGGNVGDVAGRDIKK